MEIIKNMRVCDLFDIYGQMLSGKQQQVVEEYFFNDMSLSEIAENQGISRQAVLDAISKSTAKLEEFESKLNFYKVQKLISSLEGTEADQEILQQIKELL